MSEKKEISFEIYSESEKMLEQIVDKYDLPDTSKALRCLMDYVEEKESEWDEMFATIPVSYTHLTLPTKRIV